MHVYDVTDIIQDDHKNGVVILNFYGILGQDCNWLLSAVIN